MKTFFSTFVAGFGEVVLESLKKDLTEFSEKLRLDGLIVYETSSGAEQIKKINYLNNSFLLIEQTRVAVQIEDLINIFIKGSKAIKSSLPEFKGTIRPVFSSENQLVSVGSHLEKKLLAVFKKDLNLTVELSNPETELWFVKRREGWGGIGLRITRHPDYKDVLEKGELRPEIANLLCILSEPQGEDVFLDPFAGSGAISRARKIHRAKRIIAGDLEPKRKDILKMDALKMREIDTGVVDKIVTDPPWGIYTQLNINLNDFYSRMLTEFYRVLGQKGLAVLLIGDKEVFDEVLKKFEDKFTLAEKLEVLVSGKKAGVYKLMKTT